MLALWRRTAVLGPGGTVGGTTASVAAQTGAVKGSRLEMGVCLECGGDTGLWGTCEERGWQQPAAPPRAAPPEEPRLILPSSIGPAVPPAQPSASAPKPRPRPSPRDLGPAALDAKLKAARDREAAEVRRQDDRTRAQQQQRARHLAETAAIADAVEQSVREFLRRMKRARHPGLSRCDVRDTRVGVMFGRERTERREVKGWEFDHVLLDVNGKWYRNVAVATSDHYTPSPVYSQNDG
jgi:hypothetical protein